MKGKGHLERLSLHSLKVQKGRPVATGYQRKKAGKRYSWECFFNRCGGTAKKKKEWVMAKDMGKHMKEVRVGGLLAGECIN